MSDKKPAFPRIEIVTPSKEELADKNGKANRFSYEWYMESVVNQKFNWTQQLAEKSFNYIESKIKRIAILAATSIAISLFTLVLVIITLYH